MSDPMDDLLKEVEKLTAEVSKLKALDLDNLSSGRSSSAKTTKSTKTKKTPDWVIDWNRRHASNGAVKTVVQTTVDEATKKEHTTLVSPPVVTRHKRNLDTEEVEEFVVDAGLPDHLRLDVKHADRPSPIKWADQPTHDTIVPHGIAPSKEATIASNPNSDRGAREYLAANPGKPLDLSREEGPTKPMRKQIIGMNKVWKYRNFKKCLNCESFDTWEARYEAYSDGVNKVHAEIWCTTCGSVDFEVAKNNPSHIGSWAPPKETPKQAEARKQRSAYRRERAIFSLVQKPKTAQQLCVWFREVEKYEAVDFVMIEIMLKRMSEDGLVVQKNGVWWDAEDFLFENTK